MSRPILIALVLALLIGAKSIASFVIDYQWWREIGQLSTWVDILLYGSAPKIAVAAVFFGALWLAHAGAMKRAGTGLREFGGYARLITGALAVFAFLAAFSLVDSWTVVRYFGGRGSADATSWRDPVFQQPLAFYFFELPFYRAVLRLVMFTSLVTAALYWVAWHIWEMRAKWASWGEPAGWTLDLSELQFTEALESGFFRGMGAVALLAWALGTFLGRYDLLYEERSSLTGIDWVSDHVSLPLIGLTVGVMTLCAVAVLLKRPKFLVALPVVLLAQALVPGLVYSVYVRPSEITIQKPYIARHIEATRAAYGLSSKVREVDFPAKLSATIQADKHKPLLDNVRLWDWRAFHDTVTQIQALRPYYVFHDSDVDRYMIDGKLRQLLATPRELDVRQLPADARSRWINPHFIYTHGYGLVVAEASRMTPEGLPLLLVQNAPPEVKTASLKLTRPEIYYGEVTHEPVFVRTAQAEFNYPQGAGNVESHYEGTGGFPIASLPLRFAAAVQEGDWNILLTSYLTGESRMMIRRDIRARLEELAGFLLWDGDPYLVITKEGRQVWMVDGYTTSDKHPYSREFSLSQEGRVNYIRNSVKATVDAYDGTVKLYAFDEQDPILRAYRKLFPNLVQPASDMPADLRAHARYPELIFRLQAEVYRTYHMKDPEAFFNKEDMWDLARNLNGPSGSPEPASPTYVVASMPEADSSEFLLLTTFTPRNKDNLIGLMVARCDGENLGELVFLLLSKQELIFGPMQIEARISQDQNISKDLTLWNQQGSQVLRGQMLVLPVEHTLLYIEPIYIQASQARMPQLKKVVLAMGNHLVYTDTYDQAIAELLGTAPERPSKPAGTQTTEAAAAAPSEADRRLQEARTALQKYRELMTQGHYAEAGRQLEIAEKILTGK